MIDWRIVFIPRGQGVTSKDLVRSLLAEPVLFFVVIFILYGAAFFTTLEVVWPARVVSYRVVLRGRSCLLRRLRVA